MDRFIADLHFNHKNVIKYDNRPFKDVVDMNNTIIENWNNVVLDNDTVYILGDIGFGSSSELIEIMNKLKGKKVLIKGNHDSSHLKDYNFRKCFAEITDYKEININNTKIVLCHYPILAYNGAYRNSYMLYGHVHNSQDYEIIEKFRNELKDKNLPSNIINVGAMMPYINFGPKTFDEIKDN